MRYGQLLEGKTPSLRTPIAALTHEVLTAHGYQPKSSSQYEHPDNWKQGLTESPGQGVHADLQAIGWRRERVHREDSSEEHLYSHPDFEVRSGWQKGRHKKLLTVHHVTDPPDEEFDWPAYSSYVDFR